MKNQNLEQFFERFVFHREVSEGASKDTIKGYRQVFGLFQKLMPSIEAPEDLDERVLSTYFNKLRTRQRIVGKGEKRVGVKQSTIRTHWSKLNTFFKWMITRDILLTNPLKHIKPPKPDYSDKRELPKRDFEKLIAAINLRYKSPFLMRRDLAMLGTLFFCGLRRGELIGLQLRDIDLQKRILKVRGETSKSKKTRLVPMHSVLAIYLDDYIRVRAKKKHTSEKLFVSINSDSGLTTHGLKHWVKKLSRESGVRFHLHQIRHTFATNLARSGISPISLRNLMGHTDLRTTMRYVRSMTVEDYRNDIEKLNVDNMI